ncbi:hypothetical protein V6N13_018279 [Hibiscus sabdariffa]|uniref:TF-B3 domain-containing protein n=1 Tax=Hibiscus sabdariffa TaxID=183260 RepID=A0ABR2EMF5_9ROSI
MAEIFSITLRSKHESMLKFDYAGQALPGASSILLVRKRDGGSWNFNCRSDGGGRFTIKGRGWEVFFKTCKTDDIVTLSIETGHDFYTISVH